LGDVVQISESNWHLFLREISHEMNVFVPVKEGIHIEYQFYNYDNRQPIYNLPLPVTPLKLFFLPVKENVVISKNNHLKNLIIGAPSCDIEALKLLDEIYLDDRYPDLKYREKRDNTILIGTDCHEIRENCHCTTYGIDPYPVENVDATLVSLNGEMIITVKTSKGKGLIDRYCKDFPMSEPAKNLLELADARRSSTREQLTHQNAHLPDYAATGVLISKSGDGIWEKNARTCVSCGACATICPTCTCFLLIDRPGFEKVRQMDACQYPGFERIAAGEDPLHKRPLRFKNRYLCKYVWKSEKFKAQACTGCGRCIDCCIGNINKNKIFAEMMESS
jgi:ferredoxin